VIERKLACPFFSVRQREFLRAAAQIVAIPEPRIALEPVRRDPRFIDAAFRLAIFVGVDDVIVEGVRAGAVGWIAGLVNAFPRESVALYNYAMRGEKKKADELYKWFFAVAADGHRPQVRAAYQARAAGSRHGPRTGSRAAPRDVRSGTQNRAGNVEDRAGETSEGVMYGVRWQAKRDTAFGQAKGDCKSQPKAPSPLRSAGAVQII
jgi:hypothetical protein